MAKKEIRILRQLRRYGKTIEANNRYVVKIIQIGFSGNLRMNSFGLHEGYFLPSAIVEFENGSIATFVIDDEIQIVGDYKREEIKLKK